jgi:hypothetical protein
MSFFKKKRSSKTGMLSEMKISLRETFQFCWNALLSLEKGIQFLGTRSFFSKFFTVNSSPISSFFF